jgi:hypothetical protein
MHERPVSPIWDDQAETPQVDQVAFEPNRDSLPAPHHHENAPVILEADAIDNLKVSILQSFVNNAYQTFWTPRRYLRRPPCANLFNQLATMRIRHSFRIADMSLRT